MLFKDMGCILLDKLKKSKENFVRKFINIKFDFGLLCALKNNLVSVGTRMRRETQQQKKKKMVKGSILGKNTPLGVERYSG